MKALRADPEFGPKVALMHEINVEVEKCVEHVMLDIAFSPVIFDGGTTQEDAVAVDYKTTDGRYFIRDDGRGKFRTITAAECQKARARYLVIRGREMQPFYDHFKKA